MDRRPPHFCRQWHGFGPLRGSRHQHGITPGHSGGFRLASIGAMSPRPDERRRGPIFPPQEKCNPLVSSSPKAAMHRFFILSLAALLLALWSAPAAFAQSRNGGPRIDWEVKNRFRLFRSEADFQRHVAADRGDGLLAAEDRLARESDGRGWARDTVERLCVDRAGKLLETCDRDGTLEDYLVPRDHRIGVALAGTMPANTGCAWSLDDGTGTPRETT